MKPLRRALFTALAISIFWSGLFAGAQSKPDVNGTWKMNPAKSKFEGGGPSAITITLDQQGTTLQESLSITNQRGARTTNFTYTLDGKERIQQMDGHSLKTSAKWDGETLVIEFKEDDRFNFLRKITVSADGKTMTIQAIEAEPSPSSGTTDIIILEKQ